MTPKSHFETADEHEGKLTKKVRDSPFMVVGLAGFVLAGLIGAYKYKNRGSMSTSVYLMQLRVAAQGTVVSALTIGLAYTMYKEYILKEGKPKEDSSQVTN